MLRYWHTVSFCHGSVAVGQNSMLDLDGSGSYLELTQ
jgi:hypothetical protein